MRDADDIRIDVDRGLEVVALMDKLKKERDAIEERLKTDALDRPDEHEPLADEDRDGRQFIAVGSTLNLPIVITADKIVKSFTAHTPVHVRIAKAADAHLQSFYSKKVTYEAINEDGKAFRKAALDILGDELAPPFITACIAVDKHGIPKNDVKVEWLQAAAHAKLEEVAKPALA